MQVQLSPQRTAARPLQRHSPRSPQDEPHFPSSSSPASPNRVQAHAQSHTLAQSQSQSQSRLHNRQHESSNHLSNPQPDTLSNATSTTVAAPAAAAARPSGQAASFPDYMPNSMFASFTKSRNWAQKLIDEVTDLICVLTPQGNIVFASSSCRSLVGFGSDEMVHRHISEFIHPDDARHMALAVSTAARTGQAFHLTHRYRRKNADYVILEIHGRAMPSLASYRSALGLPLASTAATASGLPLRDPTLIVSVGREYPGKLSPFLDSVLDLKIEHERLDMRRAEVEASVARNAALKRKQWMQLHTQPLVVLPAASGSAGLELAASSSEASLATASGASMSPEDDATSARERSGSMGADDSTSSSGSGSLSAPSRPMPSIPDMPIGHTPSTMGIFGPPAAAAGGSAPTAATGTQAVGWYDTSPGAAEIMRGGAAAPAAATAPRPMPVAVPSSSSHAVAETPLAAVETRQIVESASEVMATEGPKKKRKKRVVADILDRVCISCGSTSSPEWRKGPTGAKTLCNACGLRYAKKVKTEAQALAQQQGGEGGGASGEGGPE